MASTACYSAPGVSPHNADIIKTSTTLIEQTTALPQVLKSKMAWSGADFMDTSRFIVELSAEHIEELEEALDRFLELGIDGDKICRDNFGLPKLAEELDSFKRNLYNGIGFGLIRGLDPRKYSVENLTMIHLAIQAYVADAFGRQDERGNMLVHVKADPSTKLRAEHHRHSQTAITFHTEEAGDIVSWLTRASAPAGGDCVISSAYTIYNVLAASRPDLLRCLSRADWPFAYPTFQCRPIMFLQDEQLIMNFGRTPLMGSAAYPRSPDLPALSAKQIEALDHVEMIARATELRIKTRPGDIHMINNLAVLHRRDGFSDGQGMEHRRHLVRMRLRDTELGWQIPKELQDEWSKAFSEEGRKVWHLEPMPDGYFPLRSHPN